jgi:hypothetical protein
VGIGTLIVVSAVSFASTACSGGQGDAKSANIKPGEMPAASDWSGVYYDVVYGNLHLVRQGDLVSGAWRTDAGDKWGELAGTAEGNLLKYEWKEHRIGMVGPSATISGRGYFVYKAPKAENDPDYIEGERGIGSGETGQNWKGIKQVNKTPNPESVKPDEVESQGTGDTWDESGGAPKGDAAASEDAE